MKKSYKRIISAVLAIVLFTSNFPVLTQAGSGFSIACEGETVSQVEFYANEKLTVSAENLPGGSYQWQINIPGTDQWVNIQGQTGQTLNLTYALLGSLMDGSRSASVRCAAMNGSEAIEYSDPLRATILEEVAKVQPMSFMPENIGNVLPEATVPETAEPAETVPVIPEATIPEETWPFVPGETEPVIPETTAPAETEPVVPETTAPAETEPVVPETTAPAETEPVVPETTAPVETEPVIVPEATAPAQTEPVKVPVPIAPAETKPVEIPVPIVSAKTEPVPVASSASAVPEVVIFEEAQSSTEPPMALEVTPVTEPQILEPVIVPETTVPVETEPVVVPETTAPAETEPVVVPETTAPAETEPAVVPETTAPAETEAVIFSTSQDSVSMNQAEAPSPVAEEDFVDVTIKYIYWDRVHNKEGDQTWDPYVAHIQSGSDFSAIVRNKVVPAYKTAIHVTDNGTGDTIKLVADENGTTDYDPDQHTTSYVSLDLKNVTKNIVITVYYIEIQVPYSARYFLQNPYNDLYTEKTDVLDADTIAQMKGYKGEDPRTDLIYPDISGFSVLFHQPETIAADGSTVFEVYYDRNYYLINFDLNGGFGTAPVYARYDTGFTVPRPTRPGYTFAGWELIKRGDTVTPGGTIALALPTKIPAENHTYKANWTNGDTTFAIVYWQEDPDTAGKYNYMTSETIDAKSGDLVSAMTYLTDAKKNALFGNDAPYILTDETRTQEEEAKQEHIDTATRQVIVQGDGSTVLNVYFKPKEYKLRFYYAATISGNHYVIGGAVAPFADYTNTTEVTTLLNNNFVSGQWGKVSSLPELNAKGKTRNYGEGSITYNGKEFHFIEFTAKYGGNIENLWPIDVFTEADCSDGYYYNSGYPCYQAGWAGEYNVQYSRDKNNPSQTIKGVYRKLVKELLWQNEGTRSGGTVNYLGWYVNAAYASWSHPIRWVYEIYVPLLEGETADKTKQQDGITYKLLTSYNVYDSTGWSNTDAEIRRNMPQIEMDGYSKAREVIFNVETPYPAPEPSCQKQYRIQYFYSNKEYTLSYFNYGKYEQTDALLTKTMSYQQEIPCYGVPPYPVDSLEPNAYIFEGWYPSTEFLPETKVFDADGTYVGSAYQPRNGKPLMPSSNVGLYANWIPVTYDVYFYHDYDQLMADENLTDAQLEASVLGTDNTVTPHFFQCRLDTNHGERMITSAIDGKPAFPALQLTLPNEDKRTFVQWFYLDAEGKKVAFNPGEMAVRRNMRLFAEWTSSNSVSYEVNYLLGEQNGTAVSPAIPLADMTTGYGFEATTRTFQAKSVEQLNLLQNIPDDELDDYIQEGESLDGLIWLPNTSSHSILLKAPEPDPNNPGATVNPNTYSFVYVASKYAPYEVRYVNKETGQEVLGAKKEDENKNAVVTEQFVYIPGYIPDTFYKRLVLSANKDENIITFYYSKDDTYVPDVGGGGTPSAGTSLYLIKHMVQSAEDPGVFEEFTSEEGTTPINSVITATELNDPHFELIPETGFQYTYEDGTTKSYQNTASGTVTKDGLVLTLYYTRNPYNYVVKFIERDTKNELKYKETQSDGTVVEKPYTYTSQGMYQAVVEAKSVVIPGYELYRSDEDTNIETDANGNIILKKTLKISSDTDHNVITFEYYALPVTINYHVMLADANNGTCVETDVGGFTHISREEASSTKAATGAQAVPRTGYQFMGWFSDPQCQNRITAANWLSSDGRYLTPQVSFTDDVYDYDYYAKFVPITLTIRQTGMASSTDSGVYTIVNNSGTPDLSMTVIISGNDSVTIEQIPAGSYTVTETSWAWTYTHLTGNPVAVTVNASKEVTFDHSGGTSCWLYDEDC